MSATVQEAQAVITRLQALPEAEQAYVADRFNQYLNKLDDLKADIQLGLDQLDRGEAVDGRAFMTDLRERYRAEAEAGS